MKHRKEYVTQSGILSEGRRKQNKKITVMKNKEYLRVKKYANVGKLLYKKREIEQNLLKEIERESYEKKEIELELLKEIV